jgi:hypothetical protein
MHMEPLTPRDFDPDRIRPDEDAEPIVALSFLLELPHCLRIDDVAFLVSDRGGSWPGWNPDAIGYATGMCMPAPENDLKPKFLDADLDLDDKSLPAGRWYTDCYLLRNRVVHEGQKATAGEAYNSKVATGDLCAGSVSR